MQALSNLIHSHWAYLAIVLLSLGGLALLDWRLKLVAFDQSADWRQSPRMKATLATLASLIGFFLVWDISGVALGIFRTNPRFTIGLNLVTPNLPIEEVFFLALLTYVTLVVYQLAVRWYPRIEGAK